MNKKWRIEGSLFSIVLQASSLMSLSTSCSVTGRRSVWIMLEANARATSDSSRDMLKASINAVVGFPR